jgi:hypothetical protein
LADLILTIALDRDGVVVSIEKTSAIGVISYEEAPGILLTLYELVIFLAVIDSLRDPCATLGVNSGVFILAQAHLAIPHIPIVRAQIAILDVLYGCRIERSAAGLLLFQRERLGNRSQLLKRNGFITVGFEWGEELVRELRQKSQRGQNGYGMALFNHLIVINN